MKKFTHMCMMLTIGLLLCFQPNVDATLQCYEGVVCQGRNEVCSGPKCGCDRGYIRIGSQCVSATGGNYDERCTHHDECTAIPWMYCDPGENKCRCEDFHYYDGSYCARNMYDQWGNWQDSSCSVTCGNGVNTQERTRSCLSGSCSQADLRQTRQRSCSRTSCTATRYNPWGNWQDISCSVTCGIGVNIQQRRRSCLSGSCSQALRQTKQATCNKTPCKLDYGSVCTGDQCISKFGCITRKCLCADGSYYTADSCNSSTALRPIISSTIASSTNSLTVTWNSPQASGYTNSYVIKYTEEGTTVVQTHPLSGDVSTHVVTGLKAGTSYTFIVVRSISRYGRKQTVVDSLRVEGTSEKINYGQPCVSKGTCKNLRTDCYSSTCRCNPGYFWKDTTCLPNANLSPGNIDTETLSTTQLKITWTPSAYPAAVTEYLVEVSPFVSSKNIVITGTSATISSLTPGESYRITVSSRSSYLNRGETAATGAVLGITKPAPTSGLAPATSLTEPTAQIFFNKSDGRAESYTVTLTRNGYNSVQSVSGSQDILSASFPGVAAGLPYNLTVITNSYGVSSVPFTQWLRVRAEASEAVVGLSVYEVSSRAASLSWKRPINTKGALFKYSIEVYNSATCVQRINILCIECLQAMNVTEPFEISCERENNAVISQSNLNNVNFLVRYGLSLLPATAYDVVVAAYNEEGKGRTDQVTLVTEEEAPSMSNSERPIIDVVRGTETEKSVILLTCLPCLFENSNGVIVKSGILVCAKAACPIRNVKEVKTAEDYDESPNWDTSSSVSFKTWYRATGDDWLKGKEASDEIRFVLGEESCGVQDQSRFCNGPLPVDRTYRVWLFACTRVACSEGEYVEFTLLVKDKSLPLAIIGAIVGGGVLLVLAVVLLVLYIKVIRPRSQRQRSTKYVSDTSPKDDTYAEIGDGLGVVQDGRLDVDHNKKDSPPFSENTYDQLKVYSNQGQHDYGKIKVKY